VSEVVVVVAIVVVVAVVVDDPQLQGEDEALLKSWREHGAEELTPAPRQNCNPSLQLTNLQVWVSATESSPRSE
jgi:hypothetical protein